MRRVSARIAQAADLELIKTTATIAMFADDELFDRLVLKGGNAMDLIHQTQSRASVDLDFSMADDFDAGQMSPRVERVLKRLFAERGLHAFDIRMSERPGTMPPALGSFWGGYLVEFKLIDSSRAREVDESLEIMRREAIRLGEGARFTIDISRHEYTAARQEYELEGYVIYAYPPEMIVCEKLRAICQQMPEYGPVIQRSRPGNQRARDFIDIDVLLRGYPIDLGSERIQAMLREVFAVKRVPLILLDRIRDTRDFHATGYQEVRAAMRPGISVEPFDAYFDRVVTACELLRPLWSHSLGNV